MNTPNSSSALTLTSGQQNALQRAIEHCTKLATDHKALVGALETALGAGLIYYGLQTDALTVGRDLVGSKLKDVAGMSGMAAGAIGAPAIATTLLKSIFVGGVSGVAGVTLLPAVPVLVLAGGGAAILGAFGYTAAGLYEELFSPDLMDILSSGSLLAIGLALMIDGTRRIIKDEKVLKALSSLKDGVITLSATTGEVVAKSMDDLKMIAEGLAPKTAGEAAIQTGSLATGAAIGGSVAASTVTVLGSHSLGSAAIALGVVSAPAWPIFIGGAVGLVLGAGAIKGFKHYKKKLNTINTPEQITKSDDETVV